MSWGGYFFFYDCPACGTKFRWHLDDMTEADFGACPACKAAGTLVGETKDVTQGDTRFDSYIDI